MSDNHYNPQVEIEKLEAKLVNIQQKYVPVSEERLNKLWGAVRGSMDGFTQKLANHQIGQHQQNEKISTLAADVQALKEQVVLLSALTQGGMPVPKE